MKSLGIKNTNSAELNSGPPPQAVVDFSHGKRGEPPMPCCCLIMAIFITALYFFLLDYNGKSETWVLVLMIICWIATALVLIGVTYNYIQKEKQKRPPPLRRPSEAVRRGPFMECAPSIESAPPAEDRIWTELLSEAATNEAQALHLLRVIRDLNKLAILRDLPLYKSLLEKYGAQLVSEDKRLQCPTCRTTLQQVQLDLLNRFRCPTCKTSYICNRGIDY